MSLWFRGQFFFYFLTAYQPVVELECIHNDLDYEYDDAW